MLLLTRWLNLSTQRLWPITNEGGDRYSILADWSVLCGLLITREIKPHCRKCNYPFALCRFFSFSFQGKKEKKSLGLKRRLLRLSIFCSVLHLADFPTGAFWTWWVLIQRQLAVLMDDQPSASFFSFSFPFFFFNMQCELPIEEERGEERLRSG